MSDNNHEESPGFFASVRNVGSTFAATVQNRMELFAVELREQKFHVVQLLVLAGAVIFLGLMALILVTATVVFLFPPELRIYAFAGFDALYLGGAVWAYFKLKNGIQNAPTPFSETISELKKDREWLKTLK